MDEFYSKLANPTTAALNTDEPTVILDTADASIRTAAPRVRKGLVFFNPNDSATKVVVTVREPGDSAPNRAEALSIGPMTVGIGGEKGIPIQGDKIVYATRVESGKAARVTVWEAF